MQLPANFEGPPGEEMHRYFRNACHEFKKLAKSSRDAALLQQEMQKFIEVSRQMNWHPKTTGVYRKAEGEKVADRIYAEFKRYVNALLEDPLDAKPSDLISALDLMEQLIKNFKVT